MNKHASLACSTAVSVLLLTGTASADNYVDALQAEETVVGAWEVEVTVRANATDCTIAEPVGFPNPFPSLFTFHQGGTMSETGSRSPPSARGPGHGIWKHATANIYKAYLTFQRYDANGLLSGDMDITSRIRLAKDGNSFKAVSRFVVTDISGNAMPFCATLDGNRLAL